MAFPWWVQNNCSRVSYHSVALSQAAPNTAGCAPELESGTITRGGPWHQAIRLLPDGAEDEDRCLELLVARATCWQSGQAGTRTQVAPKVCLPGQPSRTCGWTSSHAGQRI